MIVFPTNFTETKYSGYFWNIEEKKLYSIKVGGVLKPLTHRKAGKYGGFKWESGYQVSVNGQRRKLTDKYLSTLAVRDSTIKVVKKPKASDPKQLMLL